MVSNSRLQEIASLSNDCKTVLAEGANALEAEQREDDVGDAMIHI